MPSGNQRATHIESESDGDDSLEEGGQETISNGILLFNRMTEKPTIHLCQRKTVS